MYSTYDDVFDAALSLPPGLRAMLALTPIQKP
jgi:hypothetical protein